MFKIPWKEDKKDCRQSLATIVQPLTLLVFSLSIFREISVLDLLCFTVYLSLIFLPVYIRDGKRITNQKPHAQIKTTHTFKPRGLIFVLNKLKLDPEVFI